jgi:hypothetical protein
MAKTTKAAKKVPFIRLLIADCEMSGKRRLRSISLLDLPCRVEMYETQHIWGVIQLTHRNEVFLYPSMQTSLSTARHQYKVAQT